MAIILEKGKSQDLSISKIRIGLGWEPNEDKSDFPHDLDVSAFMLLGLLLVGIAGFKSKITS